MVFQHFNLFNNKTVLQNIMMAPVYLRCKDLKKDARRNQRLKFQNLFRGSNKKELIPVTQTQEQIKNEVREQAMALLQRIGLEDKADVYPSTLSGGQKQRIAIIRSLAMDPDVILFDERFIVFEIDKIKDDPVLFPIVVLIIMDVFLQKMRIKKGRKALIIEEAWKAIEIGRASCRERV